VGRQEPEGNVRTRDIVEAASVGARDQGEGADIVMRCRLRLDVKQGDMMENASFFVAGVEGIDAVFTATSIWCSLARRISRSLTASTPKNGTLGGKPAVMGGFWGSHMGLIDLLLESDGGKWRVVSATSEARPIYERVDNKEQGGGRGRPEDSSRR